MSTNIEIVLSKLLPSQMRAVPRWEQYMVAFQDVLEEYITDNVNRIIDQTNIFKMSKTDIINLSKEMGYTISNLEGFADTLLYFQREILTVVPRVKYKTTRKAYLYTYSIFWLTGEVYPTYTDPGGTGLIPVYDWWTMSEEPKAVDTLDYEAANVLYLIALRGESAGVKIDHGWKFDTMVPIIGDSAPLPYTNLTTDDIRANTLDNTSLIDMITRNLVLSYHFLLAETSTTFLITNTIRSFYEDCQKCKRITETLYFEPVVDLFYSPSGTIHTHTWGLFDQVGTVDQWTGNQNGSGVAVGDIGGLALGTGSWTPQTGLTGVQVPILTLWSGEITVADLSGTVTVRRNLQLSGTVPDFTEAALFDHAGNCILYSTFPSVGYYEKMYGNFRLDLVTV